MGTKRRWLPPVVLLVLVVLLGLVPVLRTPSFYFWDDSAAVFLPTWRAIGNDLLAGTWPTLRPDLWMGGNWAAEAQFGLWNPVNLLICVTVALLPDLAVAAAVVKISALVLLAFGCYMLAREYGASAWLAVGVASALPFTGFTLYYDAATWIAGLLAFAWTAWFWWGARRCSRGLLNPGVVFVLGYLLMTNGNPYGALGAVFVLAALAVETLLTKNYRGLIRLVVVGVLIGMTAAVTFLPLILTSDEGWRTSSGIANDGFLTPDLSMLAATSSPSALPFIRVWVGSGSTVPVTYSAWFLLPLLSWLDWSALKNRGAELSGLGAFLVMTLAMALGPSQLWLFRWPVRLLPYAFLALVVLLALLLTAGPKTSFWRVRAAVCGGIVLAGFWLAFSAQPDLYVRHGQGLLLTLVLVAALVAVILRRPAFLPALMIAGTFAVMISQVMWSPTNRDVAVWEFPASDEELAAYAGRYEFPVMQIATPALVPPEERPAAWDDLLFGSMPAAAGVESTASYTGIGNSDFSQSMCMNHAGATCGEALTEAFSPGGELVPIPQFVDAFKARTVVVQNALVPDAAVHQVPAGWVLGEQTRRVTVFERTDPVPWPDSRLAATTLGVSVGSASATDTTERLTVSTGDEGGALLFARLAWPGYTVHIDGATVDFNENPEGFLEVALPAGLSEADVTIDFRVPGYSMAVPMLALAVGGAAIQALLWDLRRRRGRIPQQKANLY